MRTIETSSSRARRGTRAGRATLFLALLTLVGCATQKGVARPSEVKVGGPQVGQGKPVQPEISTRAKLLFEDAVKLAQAQERAGTWDYATLERKFQAAVNEDPDLAEAEYDLGVLAERQGKKAEAVAHYQAALRKKPTLKQAAENLAVIMQNDGNVQGAVQIYQKILERYPDDGSSRARLAEIYLQQGDHERAMEMAREALIREPKTLTAYKVMMRSNLERGQLSMARLVALRAQKLDDKDPELYFTVGQIFLKEKDRDHAIIQFNKALEVRPDYLPAHVELAKISMQNEDYAGAEEHIRHLLQADAKNAEAHVALGVAYKGMGQFDKALQEYEQAEKLDPELASVYLDKGVILARYKNAPEKGLELFKKYVALSGEVNSEAPVFKLIDETQDVLKKKEEERLALEEAARMEAEAKRQAEEQKKLEAEEAAAKKGATEQPKTEGSEGKKSEEKKVAAPAPAPAAKPAAPVAAPAKSSKSNDEPSDEPVDNL